MLLDIRSEDEYRNSGVGVNLPLALVRLKAAGMDRGRQYIAVCNDGKQSAVAAFLMSQKGLNVHVLKGGLGALGKTRPGTTAEGRSRKAQGAEIVNLASVKQVTGNEGRADASQGNEAGHEYDLLKAKYEEIQSALDDAMRRAESADLSRAHLAHEVSRLNDELEQARRHAGQFSMDQERITDEIRTESNRRIDDLEARLSAAVERAAASEQAHVAANEVASKLASELEASRESMRRMQDDLAAAQGRAEAEAMRHRGELESELADARQRAALAEAQRQEVEAAVARLQAELADSRLHAQQIRDEAARTHDEDAGVLQQRIKALQGEMDVQRQQIRDNECQREALEQEIGRLTEALGAVRRDLELEARRVVQSREEADQARAALEAEHAALARGLEGRIEQAVQERDSLQHEQDRRGQEIALLTEERSQLMMRIETLEQSAHSWEAKSADLRSELEGRIEQVVQAREALQHDYDRRGQEIAELTDERDRLSGRIESLEQERERAQVDLARLEHELSGQDARFEQSRREGEVLLREVEADLLQRLGLMEARLGDALQRALEAEEGHARQLQEVDRLNGEMARSTAEGQSAMDAARADARRKQAEFQTTVENVSRLLLEQTAHAESAEQARREQEAKLDQYRAELEEARRQLEQSAGTQIDHAVAAETDRRLREAQSALDEARQRVRAMEHKHSELELEVERLRAEAEDARQRVHSAEQQAALAREDLDAQTRKAEKAKAEAEFAKTLIKVKEARSERMKHADAGETGETEFSFDEPAADHEAGTSGFGRAVFESGDSAAVTRRPYVVPAQPEPKRARPGHLLMVVIILVLALAAGAAAYMYAGMGESGSGLTVNDVVPVIPPPGAVEQKAVDAPKRVDAVKRQAEVVAAPASEKPAVVEQRSAADHVVDSAKPARALKDGMEPRVEKARTEKKPASQATTALPRAAEPGMKQDVTVKAEAVAAAVKQEAAVPAVQEDQAQRSQAPVEMKNAAPEKTPETTSLPSAASVSSEPVVSMPQTAQPQQSMPAVAPAVVAQPALAEVEPVKAQGTDEAAQPAEQPHLDASAPMAVDGMNGAEQDQVSGM